MGIADNTDCNYMKKPGAAYREHLLESSIPDKIELIKKKIEKGYPMDMFHRSGNGIKTLIKSSGRLTDFKGIFIITNGDKTNLVLGDSINVIFELQKLSRAQRVKDKELLHNLGLHFGGSNHLDGQEILNAASVNWIEVADKTERVLVKRALRRTAMFTL